MHRLATGAGAVAALALIAAAPSSQSWDVPTSAERPEVVRMDAQGNATRVVFDELRDRPLGESSPLVGAGWDPLGPFGGDVDDVGASPTSPNVVLAGIAPSGGTGGALFRSTDGAATWSEVCALSGTSVHDIEFDPSGKVYIGTIDGVWTSTNDGVSWTQQNLGIGVNDQTFEVTIDPNDANRVWAGVADALGNQTKNVLLSTNGGVTWTDMTPTGAAGMGCAGICLDPNDSNKVFAAFGGGFGGGMVWVSDDGGATWANRSAGLPGNPMNDVVHDGTRALLVGGQLFGSQFVGLYETTDDGVSWVALHDGTWPNLVTHDIELDPADANTIYVASAGSGVYKSTDGGASWSFGIGGTGAFSVNEISVDPGGGTPVYVGSSSVAVWKSTDGTNFTMSSVGIGSLNLESIAYDPNDGDALAVAFQGLNDGGVYSTTDGGTTWDLEDLPGTRFNTVQYAPGGTLYAISDGPTTIAPEGVYRRDASGVWVCLGPDQGSQFESELYALVFSEVDSNLIVAGGADFGVAGFEPTVWVSHDAGASWSKNYEPAIEHEDVRDVVILPDGTDLNMVAAYTDFGTTQDGGALLSTDGGASWAESNTGIAGGAQCYGLAASHFDDDTVYLTDDDVPFGAVYRSTDSGATWTGMGFTERVRDVVTDPVRPMRLYIAASSGAKVRYSDDEGATFTALDSGLGTAGWTRDLKLIPGGRNTLLLATANGAYAEYEGGCTLEADVTSLSVSAGGTLNLSLAAGAENGGRWYVVLGSTTGTDGIPVGGIMIPLTFDAYTQDTISQANGGAFANTLGLLDPNGMSAASVTLPPGSDPGLIGLEVWHAYGVFTIGPFTTYRASNAVKVVIDP